jgi:chromosome segregation ATPase
MTGPKPGKSTKKPLPQESALVEALEGQIEILESQLAFVRSQLTERQLERDRWMTAGQDYERQLRVAERERDEQTERAQRYGARCHQHEQEELRLRRRLEAAESNLGGLVAAKHVVVFSGELDEFTEALTEVVERLRPPVSGTTPLKEVG